MMFHCDNNLWALRGSNIHLHTTMEIASVTHDMTKVRHMAHGRDNEHAGDVPWFVIAY
jgi:hypothetical protein